MKKFELVVGDKQEVIVAEYPNHRVFGSVGCPEHKTLVIVAVPDGQPLDVDCAIQTITELMRRILEQAEEPEYEN